MSGSPATAGDDDAQWMAHMNANLQRNQPYAATDDFTTKLSPNEEQSFQAWVKSNHVPFNPRDPVTDYDMRGYWKDLASKGQGETSVNANDGHLHFPDTYKTPYHNSFSNESRYAKPDAPHWANGYQLVDQHSGRPVYDEAAENRRRVFAGLSGQGSDAVPDQQPITMDDIMNMLKTGVGK